MYRAIDQRDGTVVAIKEIPLRGLDAAALRAITVETDLLSSLSHPNVVAYLGTVETKSYRYIVLELAENGSLAGIVKPTRFGPCRNPSLPSTPRRCSTDSPTSTRKASSTATSRAPTSSPPKTASSNSPISASPFAPSTTPDRDDPHSTPTTRCRARRIGWRPR